MILSDTDCIIDYLKNRAPENGIVRRALIESELMVSAVSVFELYFGESTGNGRAKLDELLRSVAVIPVTRSVAVIAAERGAALSASGMGLAMPDLLIAATALEIGAQLITRNRRHFLRIDGLKLAGPD